MIEELPDDIEQDELDDIEPVGDENQRRRGPPPGVLLQRGAPS